MNAASSICVLSLLAVSLSMGPSTPATDVCPLFGPHVHNTSGGPIIVDLGSTGSLGADCADCVVKGFHVKVIWPSDGSAFIGGFGYISRFDVRANTATEHMSLGNWPIECDLESSLAVALTPSSGGAQVQSTVTFVCGECT